MGKAVDGAVMRGGRSLALLETVAFVVLSVAGCHRAAPAADSASADASVAAPFVVREDSTGLLFTWVDEKGDFHVEQKVSDVPFVGRDAVRAVDPTRDETTHGDTVYVADLRVASLDGSYPVHTMSRDDFDALALTRREKSGKPTLTSVAARDAGGGGNAGSADRTAAGRPAVIVYGASWCSACHQAMAYFKKNGITFIDKDIEKDPAAAEEMNGKLRRAGLRGGSIPVLDVRGKVMIGFEPHAVEEALGSPI
jgi:glutaredoxin